MKYLLTIFFFSTLLFCLDSYAQKDEQAIKEMVESKRFTFQAQSAQPMKGGLIQLSQGYGFSILSDSLICTLPYYGRAYSATLNPSDAGFNFTTTDFEYTVKNRKKGGWDIKIKTKAVRNYPQIYLTISASGNTSVRMSSTDRESISYSGYLKQTK